MLEVFFYKTDSGNEPVKDWIKGQNKDNKRIIGEDIKTLQLGWPIGMPLVRKMEDKLWELRIRLSEGIVRVFFTLDRSKIVLLHGFSKKSNKTPVFELEIAQLRKRNYFRGVR